SNTCENGWYDHDGAILRDDPLRIIETRKHPRSHKQSGEPVHYCNCQLTDADNKSQGGKSEFPFVHASLFRLGDKTKARNGTQENNPANIEGKRETADAPLEYSPPRPAPARFLRQLRLTSIDQVITNMRRTIMASLFRRASLGKINCPLRHL